MEENKKERKQFVFDVSPEIHKKIKMLSVMRNISMNNWMQRAINERLAKEAKSDEEIE